MVGIASGSAYELRNGRSQQLFGTRTACGERHRRTDGRALETVLPLELRMGWDGVDELKANVRGWETTTSWSFRSAITDARRAGRESVASVAGPGRGGPLHGVQADLPARARRVPRLAGRRPCDGGQVRQGQLSGETRSQPAQRLVRICATPNAGVSSIGALQGSGARIGSSVSHSADAKPTSRKKTQLTWMKENESKVNMPTAEGDGRCGSAASSQLSGPAASFDAVARRQISLTNNQEQRGDAQHAGSTPLLSY